MRTSRSLGFVASALLALMLAIIAAVTNGSGDHNRARFAGAQQLNLTPHGPLYAAPAAASDESKQRIDRGDHYAKEASASRSTNANARQKRVIVQQHVAPKRDDCCQFDGAQRPTGEDDGRSRACCDPSPAAAPAQDGNGGKQADLRAAAHVDTTQSDVKASTRHPLAFGVVPKRLGVRAEPARLLPELVL